jgi:hypothetical protein
MSSPESITNLCDKSLFLNRLNHFITYNIKKNVLDDDYDWPQINVYHRLQQQTID